VLSQRLPLHGRQSLHPTPTSILRGCALRGINEGSSHSPIRSSPCPRPPGWNGPPLGLPPKASAPRRPRANDARQGRGQAIEHGPRTTLYDISRTSILACSLDCVRPRVAPPFAQGWRRGFLALASAQTKERPKPAAGLRPASMSAVTVAELWRRGQVGWPRRFHIAQFPNSPLLLAFAGWGLEAESGGTAHEVGRAVFTLSLAVWAWEEAMSGINWFRRLLGAGARRRSKPCCWHWTGLARRPRYRVTSTGACQMSLAC
jgi:hypothetical protein